MSTIASHVKRSSSIARASIHWWRIVPSKKKIDYVVVTVSRSVVERGFAITPSSDFRAGIVRLFRYMGVH
jgi:hypothetical protein